MLQELEEIMKKNNDPHVIDTAFRRLLGAGSLSSPGHSPFGNNCVY